MMNDDTVKNYVGMQPENLEKRINELAAVNQGLSQELSISRTANKFLSSVLDTVDALVVVVDAKGKIVRINQAFQQTIGASGQSLDNKPLWDMFLLPDDVASVRSIMQKLFAEHCRTATENYWLAKNGNLRLISWSFTALPGTRGKVEHAVGVGIDVTEREQAEEDLRINKERYQLLFNSVNDAVFVFTAGTDKKCKIIEVNEIACQSLGYSREELLQLSAGDLEIPLNPARASLIAHKLQLQGHALFEAVHVAKDGRKIPVEVNAHLFTLYGDTAILSVARDITERKVMEEKLQYMTLHDSLTDLYNRHYYDEEIRRLGRARDLDVAVIICDIDGLKAVNDTMGHQAGDDMIKRAAKVISESIREGDFAARIGGDEFAVMLYNITVAGTQTVCGRIRENLAKRNIDAALPLSISIGFAVAEGAKSIHQLVKEADDNMYREKMQRKKGVGTIISIKTQDKKKINGILKFLLLVFLSLTFKLCGFLQCSFY